MNASFQELEKYLKEKKEVIDKKLDEFTPNRGPTKVWESMRYSLMACGKRLRPVLTIAVAEILGTPIENIIPFACAVEMIHAQSLIHDDLPGMDNDDLRRGKPTNHVVYGEAMAIIAGDALFSHAFNTVALKTPKNVSAENLLKVITELSEAAGADGMCGGQAMDISFEKGGIDFNKEVLEFIHKNKTGAMIIVSVRGGAILSGATKEQLSALTSYAQNIGLAFQIIDDVMDVTKTEVELGKKTKKDENKNKATYPRLYGVDKSIKLAKEHINKAIEDISIFGEKAKCLKLLAEYVVKREN